MCIRDRQKDALKNLMEPILEDERVIACGGMIQIANQAVIEDGEVKHLAFPKKKLVLLQMLEYSRSFLGSRLFFNGFSGNMIISGACGLFQKSLVTVSYTHLDVYKRQKESGTI